MAKDQETSSIPDPTGKRPDSKNPRGGLSELSRQISDSDLKNPAVVRLILIKHDELENQIKELADFRDKFHQKDKEAAILKEQSEFSKSSITTKTLFIYLGGVGAGFLSNLYGTKWFIPVLAIAALFSLLGFLKNYQGKK